MADDIKFNIITTALLKSTPPVKNVTAAIPKRTCDIDIKTLDQYNASLLDS